MGEDTTGSPFPIIGNPQWFEKADGTPTDEVLEIAEEFLEEGRRRGLSEDQLWDAWVKATDAFIEEHSLGPVPIDGQCRLNRAQRRAQR